MRIRLDTPTIIFLMWTGVFLPFLGAVAWHRLRAGKPLRPRTVRLRLMILFSVLTALLAVAAAQSNDIVIPVRGSAEETFAGALLGVVMVLAARHGWQKAKPARRERMKLLYAPESRGQFALTIVGGLCAGIGEEIIYRGALFAVLMRLTSSVAVSVAICVLVFAVAHMPQGVRAMLAVAYLGLIFHLLYLASGTLLIAMAVHTVYDVGLFAVLYQDGRKAEGRITQMEEPRIAPTETPAVEQQSSFAAIGGLRREPQR